MKLATCRMLLTLPFVASGTVAAFADEGGSWTCRNTDFEISCADGKCAAAEAHTPMDIHVSHDTFSWCAYSGCWTGGLSATLVSGPFLSFHGIALKNGMDSKDVVDVTVVIDTESGAASILAAGQFTTPATCTLE